MKESEMIEIVSSVLREKKAEEAYFRNRKISAELIYWKEGASIRPDVERDIRNILDISDGMIEGLVGKYREMNEYQRMHALLKHNRNFLIRKETWDYIRSHILDDTVYIRFLSLISIEIDDLGTRSLLKSICNNLDFLTHHVLSRPIGSSCCPPHAAAAGGTEVKN